MFIVLSPHNPDPMYKQVTDQIKDAVASGDLKPGDRLPSIREISKELNISQITIKRAYSDLENEGMIYTRAGMGSFVADINQTQLREEKLKEIQDGLDRLIKSGEKFGISVKDIMDLLKLSGGE